jgi:hypothetical protein
VTLTNQGNKQKPRETQTSDHNSGSESTTSEDDEESSSESQKPAARPQNRRNRGTRSQYIGPKKSAITHAQREYKVRICTLNAFPDDEEMELWTRECWENACRRQGIEAAFDTDIKQMVSIASRKLHY